MTFSWHRVKNLEPVLNLALCQTFASFRPLHRFSTNLALSCCWTVQNCLRHRSRQSSNRTNGEMDAYKGNKKQIFITAAKFGPELNLSRFYTFSTVLKAL